MSNGGSKEVHVITKAAVNLNGISIAYIMGLVNAVLACLLAFGVHLTDTEIASVAGLINAAMILAVHMGHRVGEATASGASGATSRQKMEAVNIAAYRRGMELHDAQVQEPPAPPPEGQV